MPKRGPFATASILCFLVAAVTPRVDAAGSWVTNSPLGIARSAHTATLLPNGKVLVAGGATNYALGYAVTSVAEIFNPADGAWTPAGSLAQGRAFAAAALLPNGKVLVAGGYRNAGPLYDLTSAELYDPATGAWSPTGSLNLPRSTPTLTVLSNGKVLLTGTGGPTFLAPAELYDPATGQWTLTATPNVGRQSATATALTNGTVLVAGGADGGGFPITSVEIYDPASDTWTVTNSLNAARFGHTATALPNGLVLAAGGYGVDSGVNLWLSNSVELYNPATGHWVPLNPLHYARANHTASLLPDGKVLITGGDILGNSVELYDPDTGVWTLEPPLVAARYRHTATMLPDGSVLIAGGADSLLSYVATTERYRRANPAWAGGGTMVTPRDDHRALLLPNGEVLVAGGVNGSALAGAEIFRPSAGAWTGTAGLTLARYRHTLTLLPDGKALLAGGFGPNGSDQPLASLYDPNARAWTATSWLRIGRASHTATLLSNGQVLAAGGASSGTDIAFAELYNPLTGAWTVTGSMANPRKRHTATLLPGGKVLVAGGDSGGKGAELYEPQSASWTVTGSLNTGRWNHTANWLPNGKVLVIAGDGGGATAELYDPATGTWTPTGSLSTPRSYHASTLLLDGRVLVAGGRDPANQVLKTTEVYDPATGSWAPGPQLAAARYLHTATLLPSGKVLIAGGFNGVDLSAELFDPGLGFDPRLQPHIAGANSPLALGGSLVLTGDRFCGVAEGSGGGFQSSPANYPLVQLRNLESGQSAFLCSTGWSATTFGSAPVWPFPPGHALATVFANGIPGPAAIVNVRVPAPAAPTLLGPRAAAGGGFQCAFTNAPGALFGMLVSTNVTLPPADWTGLGGVTEIAPGQFQFRDAQATNTSPRFYRARSR